MPVLSVVADVASVYEARPSSRIWYQLGEMGRYRYDCANRVLAVAVFEVVDPAP